MFGSSDLPPASPGAQIINLNSFRQGRPAIVAEALDAAAAMAPAAAALRPGDRVRIKATGEAGFLVSVPPRGLGRAVVQLAGVRRGLYPAELEPFDAVDGVELPADCERAIPGSSPGTPALVDPDGGLR